MSKPNTSTEVEQLQQLHRAINNASWGALRSILRDILHAVPSARQIVAAQLLCYEDDVPEPDPLDEDDADSASDSNDDDDWFENDHDDDLNDPEKTPVRLETSTGSKRVRPRYDTCIICDKEFDVTRNTQKSCRYHPEELEAGDEEFADHDINYHGPIDTEEMREEYPEYFIFPCCGRNLGQKACVRNCD